MRPLLPVAKPMRNIERRSFPWDPRLVPRKFSLNEPWGPLALNLNVAENPFRSDNRTIDSPIFCGPRPQDAYFLQSRLSSAENPRLL